MNFPKFKSKDDVILILLIILVLGIGEIITFSVPTLGRDDYYHIKYSEILREEGIQKEMPALYYTSLRENFYDSYFLYHFLLIPFTYGDLILGAKIALLFFFALLVIGFFKFLRYFKIPYPSFWVIVFIFTSSFFMVRLLSVRPFSIATLFYLGTLFFLFTKKYKYLFPLAFGIVVVLLHNVWAADWRVIITILGWSAIAKGISPLLFPSTVSKILQTYQKNKTLWVAHSIVAIVLGTVLIYFGFFTG